MIIKGNKKGSKGGGGLSEDPNTITTNTIGKAIYILSEGPIEGLATNDAKSIYFNDVPIVDSAGDTNYQGVYWAFRTGLPDQEHIPGFESASAITGVSTQVTFSTPVTRTITGDYDAINVTVSIPALFRTDPKGKLVGTDLSFAIDVKADGGSWVTVRTEEFIKQKNTSETQLTYRVELPPGGSPWEVRVRRLTADSVDIQTNNNLYWAGYATIVDAKFSYRNTAVLGLQINAKDFQNQIPAVKCLIKGIKVWVPTNYDPDTRIYATSGAGTSGGIWDGTFKLAWTDNPVWIYHDLLINNRYGLGDDFNPQGDPESSFVDKWSLYPIAQFCDETVNTGYGGDGPRYTVNCHVTSKTEAYDLLQSIMSTINGMIYFSAEQVVAVADMPSTIDAIFTQSDVQEGIFEYSGTALKTRHSVVISYFNDPDNLYKRDQVVYEDKEQLNKLGYKPVEISTFGCTSRAQALRSAKWLLETEKNQTQTVTFRTGQRGGFVTPGNLIKIFDDYKAGNRIGGRILDSSAVGGEVTLTLDQNVTLDTDCYIIYVNSDGVAVPSVVVDPVTDSNVVTVAGAGLPVYGGTFAIITPDLDGQLYRVIQVIEEEPELYTIIALQHHDPKFAIIDADVIFGDPNTSIYGTGKLAPVDSISIEQWYEQVSGTEVFPHITISWVKPANDFRVENFELQLQTPTEDYKTVHLGPQLSWDSPRLEPNLDGGYSCRVRTVDALGRVSDWVYYLEFDVVGNTGGDPPEAPDNLTVNAAFKSILVSWDNPDISDLKHVEVWSSTTADIGNATKFANVTADYVIFQNASTDNPTYFWVRAITHAPENFESDFVGPGSATAFNDVDGTGDSDPPDEPTDVVVNGAFKSMWIEWTNPADADLLYVEVWENTVNVEPDPVTDIDMMVGVVLSQPSSSGFYHRGGLPSNTTYYYFLRAVDRAGNKSDFTIGEAGTTVTIDPVDLGTVVGFGAPTGLDLTTSLALDTDGTQIVKLIANWTAIDTGAYPTFSYYELAIQEGSGEFIVYPVGANYFETRVKANQNYTAKIRGVDGFGNRTPYSSTDSVTSSSDTTAPSAPTSLNATPSVGSIFLSWTNPSDSDLVAVEIFEHTSNVSGSATKIATVNAEASKPGGYSRSGLGPEKTRYYWLKAVDSSGNTSGFSTGDSAETLQVDTADLAAGAVTAVKIQANSITGDRFSTSTSLPGTITVGSTGVSIGTVESRAADPAARVNANSTMITPGKIQISGATTLANWRDGTDNTRIAGGSIATNSISANQLNVGLRGIEFNGITFEPNTPTNRVTWTCTGSNNIQYYNDSGSLASVTISSGATSTWSSGTIYIYWIKGATSFSTTTTAATAYGANNVVVATYRGDTIFNDNYGRTIIDGDFIKTNSINANRIQAGTITGDKIGAGEITGTNLAVDTITANKIKTNELIASNIKTNELYQTYALGSVLTSFNLSTSYQYVTNASSIVIKYANDSFLCNARLFFTYSGSANGLVSISVYNVTDSTEIGASIVPLSDWLSGMGTFSLETSFFFIASSSGTKNIRIRASVTSGVSNLQFSLCSAYLTRHTVTGV